MTDGSQLRQIARSIFDVALRKVDAGIAVKRAIQVDGSRLMICGRTIDLENSSSGVYALAIGKAAFPMASALNETLNGKLTSGLVVGPAGVSNSSLVPHAKWNSIEGGHPLPTQTSLDAAKAAFELLLHANESQSLTIFLISGGGSSMIEWPNDERISLADLRLANSILTTCGADIEEINAVRRRLSAVKNGGLATLAPQSDQITLIVSDTGRGKEATVASGPTFYPPADSPDAEDVITTYRLADLLPASILQAVNRKTERTQLELTDRIRDHFVLLDCEDAIRAAAEDAVHRELVTEVAIDINDQSIAEGCSLLTARLVELRKRAADTNKRVCLVSGGEFSCPVSGDGIGGRNSETALRCAIEFEKVALQAESHSNPEQFLALSAGTDGVDGNSPAAGAVAMESTCSRARNSGLVPELALQQSDAFSFFDALGDAIVTGPTGTNVRDLRILLAK